jgi:hypothetical protein
VNSDSDRIAANVVVVEQAKVFCVLFEKTIYSYFFSLTSNTPITNRRERGQMDNEIEN